MAGIHLVGVASLSAGRMWRQWRRTGSTGVQLPSGTLAERAGGLAFVAGLACSTAAALQEAVSGQEAATRGRRAGHPVTGIALMVAGCGLAARAQHDMADQWRIGVDPAARTELITHGTFALVRNPIFTGVLLAEIGLAVGCARPVAALGAALALAGCAAQVRMIEEPYLTRVHGDRYRQYARRTGRFVPGLGRLA